MTAKQYLQQIERLDKNIQNKLSEIYQLKTLATNVTVAMNGDRVQTSGDQDRTGKIVASLVDVEREAQSMIDEYLVKKKKIINQMNNLSKTSYYQVLYSKYVEYKTFNKIAEEMDYSWRQIIRIHGDALAEFGRVYSSEIASLNVI